MMVTVITLKNAGCILRVFPFSFLGTRSSLWRVRFVFLYSWPFFSAHAFSTVGKSMGPTRKQMTLSWMRREGQCRRPGRAPRSATASAVASPSATSLPSWVGWDSAFLSGFGATSELPSWKWSTTAPSTLMENRKFRSGSVYGGSSFGRSCANALPRERKHCTSFVDVTKR